MDKEQAVALLGMLNIIVGLTIIAGTGFHPAEVFYLYTGLLTIILGLLVAIRSKRWSSPRFP